MQRAAMAVAVGLSVLSGASAEPADIVILQLAGDESGYSVNVEGVRSTGQGLASYGIDLPTAAANIVNTGDQAGFVIGSDFDLQGTRATPGDVGFGGPVTLGTATGTAFLDVSLVDVEVFRDGLAQPAVPVWTFYLLDVPLECDLGNSFSADVLQVPLGAVLEFRPQPADGFLPPGQYNYYLQQLLPEGSRTVAAGDGESWVFEFTGHGRHDVELWVLDEQDMPFMPSVIRFDVVPEPAPLFVLAAGALAGTFRPGRGRSSSRSGCASSAAGPRFWFCRVG